MKLKMTDDQVTALLDSISMDVLFKNDGTWDSVLDQIAASDYQNPCPYDHVHTRNWCRHVLCRKG